MKSRVGNQQFVMSSGFVAWEKKGFRKERQILKALKKSMENKNGMVRTHTRHYELHVELSKSPSKSIDDETKLMNQSFCFVIGLIRYQYTSETLKGQQSSV